MSSTVKDFKMAALPAFFLLLVALVSGQRVEITPLKEVRPVGGEITVLCRVAFPIESCQFNIGGSSYIMRENPANAVEDAVYAGQGFKAGECGVHIRHIKEEWNGNVTCLVPPQSGNIAISATMKLLVARAPGDVQLQTPAQPVFREGDQFDARCVVPDGRPAAMITWLLDDTQILAGLHDPVLSPPTAEDLQTISQNLTRKLTPEDDGHRLVCRAEHAALSRPREVSRQLIVQYPPKRMESGQITIFGLKLSAEGRLNVTVRANPPPQAEWTVAGATLRPRQRDESNGAMALEPIPLGGGFYNLTLVLLHVSKEDVDRVYYLKAWNDLGEEQFTVRISTMDEPAGVELDAGAIVGIVVGVLALLLIVFLAVFAKATDRWCFAGGRGRDHTKSSGESTPAGDVLIEGFPLPTRTSDTESAVGGRPSRLAGLSARMRAALPRGKDKVQATEGQEADKPLSEEKKGVVYAELALGEQTADKPQPPSTEYAEIVYTDQPKETKE